MAGTIATLLAASQYMTSGTVKGPIRHAYDELVALQGESDPTLASPYVLATHITTIPAHTDTISSGNFTITMNFPKYGVAVTTGNVAWNASAATIQTAIDSALSGETILASYNAGDVDAACTDNLTANDVTLTANGTTVNGAYMTVTTANVDLDADELATPVVATPGTANRSAEAFLNYFGVLEPASSVTPQGLTVAEGDYQLLNEGDINAHSLSPGLLDILIKEVAYQQDSALSTEFRRLVKCV